MDENTPYAATERQVVVPPAQNPRDLVPARSITVNGRRHLVRTEQIDHGQLVRLAFPEAEDGGAKSSLTVTYRGGPYGAAEGILAPRERTTLADGETFVVTRTDKS